MNNPLENRYDFVYLFDVKDGNPNGDPDAGNLPRFDPETGHGLVTDVCLKRKVRNYVDIKNKGEGYDIYIKSREGKVLNDLHLEAREANGIQEDKNSKHKKLPKGEDKAKALTKWMCDTYYDIRTFGAVMSTEVNCGVVRGPIQLTFSRSIDPIVYHDHTITRMAATKESDKEKGQTMGRKSTVPYGLYQCYGFISAHLAEKTGFSAEDLELFFEALKNMFEHDRSAARGLMTPRGLYVFKHDSKLGRAAAYDLFQKVEIKKAVGDVCRDFSDYKVTAEEEMPEGVELDKRIG